MPALARARSASLLRAADLKQNDEQIAALAKALGHPARIRIVRLLLEKNSCIGCDIVQEIALAQSTVSEHLRILKAAGIITGEIERPRVCYSLSPESLRPLARLLDGVLECDPRGGPRGSSCGAPAAKQANRQRA